MPLQIDFLDFIKISRILAGYTRELNGCYHKEIRKRNEYTGKDRRILETWEEYLRLLNEIRTGLHEVGDKLLRAQACRELIYLYMDEESKRKSARKKQRLEMGSRVRNMADFKKKKKREG